MTSTTRRGFLGILGLGAAGVALAPVLKFVPAAPVAAPVVAAGPTFGGGTLTLAEFSAILARVQDEAFEAKRNKLTPVYTKYRKQR